MWTAARRGLTIRAPRPDDEITITKGGEASLCGGAGRASSGAWVSPSRRSCGGHRPGGHPGPAGRGTRTRWSAARAAYASKDWNEAAALARPLLKTDPGDLEALRVLARAIGATGPRFLGEFPVRTGWARRRCRPRTTTCWDRPGPCRPDGIRRADVGEGPALRTAITPRRWTCWPVPMPRATGRTKRPGWPSGWPAGRDGNSRVS